jgi:hypothetical protein
MRSQMTLGAPPSKELLSRKIGIFGDNDEAIVPGILPDFDI